jgi:hypothetical protein
MVKSAGASCFAPTRLRSTAAQAGSTAHQQTSLPEEVLVAISRISREEFKRFFNEKYALACQLLDCEAFQSWHTPSKGEWSDVLTMAKMLRRSEWPLYEVTRDGDEASSVYISNTELMMNAVHNLLDAFNGYSVASIPSPGQWGDIMRVVDETTERRAVVDQAGLKGMK